MALKKYINNPPFGPTAEELQTQKNKEQVKRKEQKRIQDQKLAEEAAQQKQNQINLEIAWLERGKAELSEYDRPQWENLYEQLLVPLRQGYHRAITVRQEWRLNKLSKNGRWPGKVEGSERPPQQPWWAGLTREELLIEFGREDLI